MSLQRLFEPTKVGNLALRNRLVMLAMGTHYSEENFATERLIRFLAERAKGGVGLIFTVFRWPGENDPERHNTGLYDDKFIPALRRLTDAVHDHGAKVGAQLTLTYQWQRNEDEEAQPVGPSQVVTGPGISPPRALTVDEIHRITGEFAASVARAREAGFDTVDVNCAAGYLIDRFLSPLANRRSDEYGGSLQNRMRFMLEIIGAAQATVGKDYPLMCRLTLDDFMPGGRSLNESKQVAAALEGAGVAGLLSYFGWHECSTPTIAASVPPGAFVHLTEEIKRTVSIPIVATNRIQSPLLAEQILSEGKADLIGMARALIADPDLANKAKEGRFDEIRPCLCCNHCLDNGFRREPVSCSVNALAGNEGQMEIWPAPQPKRIFVLGGGPTGIEAAVTAAARGHNVTLWEKSGELGGQLRPGCRPPHKENVGAFKDYLIRKLERSGVRVVLGEMPAARTGQAEPDAVIVATGAVPVVPRIPGVDGANVTTAVGLLLHDGWDDAESFVIIGGGSVGCETADFLAVRGKTVTILEMADRLGIDIGLSTRWIILKRLRDAGVRMVTGAKAVAITERGVNVERGGAFETFEGQQIVLAVGMRPSAEGAAVSGADVHLAGDCVRPAKIYQAVREGLRVGTTV